MRQEKFLLLVGVSFIMVQLESAFFVVVSFLPETLLICDHVVQCCYVVFCCKYGFIYLSYLEICYVR